MSTPVSSKVINAPHKDLRSPSCIELCSRAYHALHLPRSLKSVSLCLERKIIEANVYRRRALFFSGYSASSKRVRGLEDGRLEEWSIPDTRVDLTLLYLINYSVRYPILQFVPSHTISTPPFLNVARRRLRPRPRPTESPSPSFSFRSTNRRSIDTSCQCKSIVYLSFKKNEVYKITLR